MLLEQETRAGALICIFCVSLAVSIFGEINIGGCEFILLMARFKLPK